MWLCLNDAFLSIVSKDCARDELLVRARRRGDIERIFPDASVSELDNADYLFRARIKKTAIVQAMTQEVHRITYGNFKSSVEDDELHDAYMAVWTAMSKLQETPPYHGLLLKEIRKTKPDGSFRSARSRFKKRRRVDRIEPRFAVGQRVRIVKIPPVSAGASLHPSYEGSIARIVANSGPLYRCIGPGGVGFFADDSMLEAQ